MKDEIVLYQPNETIQLEVHLKDETVWLTQQQIADLFGVKQPAISKHIANIYKSGELEEEGTYSILEYMGHDGKQLYTTKAYNLVHMIGSCVLMTPFILSAQASKISVRSGLALSNWSRPQMNC